MVVAGEHRDLDAEAVQGCHRVGRGLARSVGNTDDPGRAPVDRSKHHGAAGGGQLVPALAQRPEVNAFSLQQLPVAHHDLSTRHFGDGAMSGDRLEPFGAQCVEVLAARVADDRRRQRMLGLPFNRGHQPDQRILGDAVGVDVGHLRLTLGQGARLVHDHDLDTSRCLQRHRVLEQHPARGAQTGADHDRRRCRQPQGVRAGDDHDRDGEQDRRAERAFGNQPRRQRQPTADQCDQHQPERGAVGQPLARRLGVLSRLHELHDLSQSGIRTDLGRPHPQGPVGVDRGPDDY